MKAPHRFDRDLVDGDCRICGDGPAAAIHGDPEKYIGLLLSRIKILSDRLLARDEYIKELEEKLK